MVFTRMGDYTPFQDDEWWYHLCVLILSALLCFTLLYSLFFILLLRAGRYSPETRRVSLTICNGVVCLPLRCFVVLYGRSSALAFGVAGLDLDNTGERGGMEEREFRMGISRRERRAAIGCMIENYTCLHKPVVQGAEFARGNDDDDTTDAVATNDAVVELKVSDKLSEESVDEANAANEKTNETNEETTTATASEAENHATTTTTKTSTICGYIFQKGDIAWNCRTCQTDPTCVLCDPCFRNSDHEGHEVQFYRTDGNHGGCCDCGDTEAWKIAGCCQLHARPNTTTTEAPHAEELTTTPELELESLSEPMCSVCFEPYTTNEITYRNPSVCNHEFHFRCLLDWLQRGNHTRCPVCRRDIVNNGDVARFVKDMRTRAVRVGVGGEGAGEAAAGGLRGRGARPGRWPVALRGVGSRMGGVPLTAEEIESTVRARPALIATARRAGGGVAENRTSEDVPGAVLEGVVHDEDRTNNQADSEGDIELGTINAE